MNYLNPCVESITIYPSPSDESGAMLATFPPEVIRNIASYLDDKDLQSAASLNRTWQKVIEWVAKHEKHRALQKLGKFLSEKLQGRIPEIDLHVIDDQTIILNSVSLISIKFSVDETIQKFLNIVGKSDSSYVTKRLTIDIYQKCIELNNFSKASEVAKSISNFKVSISNFKVNDIRSHFDRFMIDGELDKALELVKPFAFEDTLKQEMLNLVCRAWFEKGNFVKIAEVAKLQDVRGLGGQLIKSAYDDRLERDGLSKALEFIKPVGNIQRGCIQETFQKITRTLGSECALQTFNTISCEAQKEPALNGIVVALLSIPDYERALKIIDLIPVERRGYANLQIKKFIMIRDLNENVLWK